LVSTSKDAYIGQNVFLSEKVAGLIATTGAFWTGVLLPWLRSDHIGPFTWSRWEFNQVLATRVPHESVARLVTTYGLEEVCGLFVVRGTL